MKINESHGPLTLGLNHPLGERLTLIAERKGGIRAALATVAVMSLALGASADIRVTTGSIQNVDAEVSTVEEMSTLQDGIQTLPVLDEVIPDGNTDSPSVVKLAELEKGTALPFAPNDIRRRDLWPSKTVFSSTVITDLAADALRQEGDNSTPLENVAAIQYDSNLEVFMTIADESLHPSRNWKNILPLIDKAKACAVYSETGTDLRRDHVTLNATSLGLPPGQYNVLCIPGTRQASRAFRDINWDK